MNNLLGLWVLLPLERDHEHLQRSLVQPKRLFVVLVVVSGDGQRDCVRGCACAKEEKALLVCFTWLIVMRMMSMCPPVPLPQTVRAGSRGKGGGRCHARAGWGEGESPIHHHRSSSLPRGNSNTSNDDDDNKNISHNKNKNVREEKNNLA